MLLENIQKRRKTLGLTQSDLAHRADVSQSLIAKIESKKISPSFENAMKIFNTLEQLEQEVSVKAADIMVKKVYKVQASDTVNKATKLMKQKGISQLPVFENEHMVGLVSERVLMENLNKPGLGNMEVKRVMADAPPTIAEDAPLKLVSELLKYASLVVVYRQAEIKGVIAKADLLKTI